VAVHGRHAEYNNTVPPARMQRDASGFETSLTVL